eukprot:5993038-Prymnesium_polylepis.1
MTAARVHTDASATRTEAPPSHSPEHESLASAHLGRVTSAKVGSRSLECRHVRAHGTESCCAGI